MYSHIGFRKKVEKAAKKKDYELIGSWSKSMINHLYWSVMSTKDGNAKVIKEKWLSLNNHLHNKHVGHGSIYKACSHGKIKRKWFKHRKYTSIFIISHFIT